MVGFNEKRYVKELTTNQIYNGMLQNDEQNHINAYAKNSNAIIHPNKNISIITVQPLLVRDIRTIDC